jgi:hypothetical protein
MGGYVASAADAHGRNKVFVQVVDVLDCATRHVACQRHVVEHREVLHEFAKTDAARMWTNPNAEFRCAHTLMVAGTSAACSTVSSPR